MNEQPPQGFERDIPLQVAIDAHHGTSFVPEKRAEQERADYAQTMTQDMASLTALADTDEKRALLPAEFARYREGYKARTLAYLAAKTRCMSTMITGPANFPTTRNNKHGDTADRRLHELLEYRKRALDAIGKVLQPELRPIMSGDVDAGERLTDKIKESEERRESMKAANTAARKIGQEPPHPGWELQNLGANIRRMKERIEQIDRAKAAPSKDVQGTVARIEDRPAENRVRLFFPGKPEADIRDRLKRAGFRWAPTQGAWSAYRNSNSLAVASIIAGVEGGE